MEITSVRIRKVKSNSLLAIASVTFDNQMIINDIKVLFDNGQISLIFPNSEFAKKNNQYNIVINFDFYNYIKSVIIEEINKLEV